MLAFVHSDNFRFRLGIALPLVSSFTCESCDVEETKGPYSMPLFAMFVMPFICHVLM